MGRFRALHLNAQEMLNELLPRLARLLGDGSG